MRFFVLVGVGYDWVDVDFFVEVGILYCNGVVVSFEVVVDMVIYYIIFVFCDL